MNGDDPRRLDPLATAAAFARTAYGEAASVLLLSVAASLASLTLVGVGPAIVALVAVFTDAVDSEIERGARIGERERFRGFGRAFRAHLRRGLALSLVVVAPAVASAWYLRLAAATGAAEFLLGAVVGAYSLVVGVVVAFRAATLVVRSPPDRTPGGPAAVRDAAYHLLETPSFSALQSLSAGVLALACAVPLITLGIALPGLLAAMEVVSFEERNGRGADAVVSGYRRASPGGEPT